MGKEGLSEEVISGSSRLKRAVKNTDIISGDMFQAEGTARAKALSRDELVWLRSRRGQGSWLGTPPACPWEQLSCFMSASPWEGRDKGGVF